MPVWQNSDSHTHTRCSYGTGPPWNLCFFFQHYHRGLNLLNNPIDEIVISYLEVEVVIRLSRIKLHAGKMTGTNPTKHDTTTRSITLFMVSYLCGCHCGPDVHEMDRAGVLDSELNSYLCWSELCDPFLMTSRWSSSIFKTLGPQGKFR